MDYETKATILDVFDRLERAKVLSEILSHYFESEPTPEKFSQYYKELQGLVICTNEILLEATKTLDKALPKGVF